MFQVRQLLSDFAVLISIVVMVGIDIAIGIGTPKLEVPTEFAVRHTAPEEQFLLLSTIFSYLMLDFYVKTRIRFSLRDKRLFEITEVEIMRVDCTFFF